MEGITDGAVVEDHNSTEIRFYRSQIFDVSPLTKSAMLAIVASRKIFALCLEPIYHRICIFLNAGSEDDKLIPLADLAKEFFAMWSFMYIVQNRMMWSNDGW